MSVCFQAMLINAHPEDVAALNRLLSERDSERCQQFEPIDFDSAGGTKFWTDNVYAVCFNYVSPAEVEECIQDTDWRYSYNTLYVCEPGDYASSDDDRIWSGRLIDDILKEGGRGTDAD